MSINIIITEVRHLGWTLFENGFEIRMCDFEGVYLVNFINLRAPFMIFGFLVVLWGSFLGNFWVLEIYENGFGMRMCDFGRVYLVKFINLRVPYMIFGCCSFSGHSEVLKLFENVFNENVTLRGLFSEIYSFEIL